MNQPPPKKSEHIQVKVLNSILEVRGHFDRKRMESAARSLDTDLRSRLAAQPGALPDQNYLSLVLLVAIEKVYAIEQSREERQSLFSELENWRRWASEISGPAPLQKDSAKE
ncbi:MAG: hypothetical protein M1313_03225 [Nitrospirae bacterium]|nr:hypothetical protein [Nitrospirota bacterium]